MTLARRIGGAVRVVGVLLFIGGIAAGCYEGFKWLRTGRSTPVLLENVVVGPLPASMEGWIRQPDSWIGLHRIAVWVLDIPVWAVVIMVGFLVLLAAGAPRRA